LRQANAGVTQACYIKTADSDATAAMQQFGRSLGYALNMHLLVDERPPEDRRVETVLGVIRNADRFILGLIGDNTQNGTKKLLSSCRFSP
jgi:hypothetical protein